MGDKSMTAPEQARFIKSMEEQGVGVTRTTKGLLLRLPNGESTAVHFTHSDHRSQKNLMSVLRRAGVRHPEDPKNVTELPTTITQSQPVAPRTKRTILEYIQVAGYPDTVRVMDIVAKTGLVHITVTRALYQMGFKPVDGRRKTRDWVTPEEILARAPKPEERPEAPAPDPDRESPTFQRMKAVEPKVPHEQVEVRSAVVEEVVEAPPQPPQETPEPPTEREFIDTHDSWVADLARVPNPVREYIDGLRAAGLEVEIRVWRN